MKMIFLTPLALSALLITSPLPVQAQSRSSSSRSPKPRQPPGQGELIAKVDPQAPITPNSGRVVGQTYTNDFFRLTLTFPTDWFVLNQTGIAEISEAGKRALSDKTQEDQRYKAEVERAIDQRVYNLLAVRQYLSPPPGQVNASILLVAELLPVNNVTPMQFLKTVKESVMPRMNVRMDVTKDLTPEQLAGRHAAMIGLERTTPGGITIKQEHHVVIVKDYAIAIVLTYGSEEQREILRAALASMKFETGKR